MICKRLKYEGLDIGTHAEEIFDTSLSNALKHLKKHGGASVAYPNSWFKAIVRNETTRYLRQMHSSHLVWLEDVLAGGEIITQPSEEIDSDREAVMDLVRDGIEKLTPRQRELILYDLADRFTPSEIQDKMGIRSKGYFRKLKCEAFKALREAVKALIDEGVDLIF